MRRRLTIVISLLLGLSMMSRAQNVTDLIISEVLAEPDSTGIMDDYGRRTGWVEIFNKSYGTVSFGGCFLTDDRSNLKKNIIPKSDLRTSLGQRQAVVIFSGGNGDDGTFYTNFTIEPGKTVYLVSNDGRSVIDSMEVPENLPAGKSMCKFSTDRRGMKFSACPEPQDPSPNVVSGSGNSESKVQKLAQDDPHGLILTLVAVCVVFCALLILWCLFSMLFQPDGRKAAKGKKAGKTKAGKLNSEVVAAISMSLEREFGGEQYAAIGLALDLYLGNAAHDSESYTLTMEDKSGSAWRNRSLLMRKTPKR